MTSVEEVGRLAQQLPEVTEGQRYGHRTWYVGGKGFLWERPFSKADLRRFGERPPPTGPIVAVTVADLNEKEAILAAGHPGLFTIEHFDGYPAALIQLDVVEPVRLREVILDGWLACAPRALAERYLNG